MQPKHYEVRFTISGAPGVFYTEAMNVRQARMNCRLHHPTARIQRVWPIRVDA